MFHLSHNFLTVTVKVELIRIFNTKEREGLLLEFFLKRRKGMTCSWKSWSLGLVIKTVSSYVWRVCLFVCLFITNSVNVFQVKKSPLSLHKSDYMTIPCMPCMNGPSFFSCPLIKWEISIQILLCSIMNVILNCREGRGTKVTPTSPPTVLWIVIIRGWHAALRVGEYAHTNTHN